MIYKRILWVVEMWFGLERGYLPTVAVGTTRENARREMAIWHQQNPAGRFRIVKYCATTAKKKAR